MQYRSIVDFDPISAFARPPFSVLFPVRRRPSGIKGFPANRNKRATKQLKTKKKIGDLDGRDWCVLIALSVGISGGSVAAWNSPWTNWVARRFLPAPTWKIKLKKKTKKKDNHGPIFGGTWFDCSLLFFFVFHPSFVEFDWARLGFGCALLGFTGLKWVLRDFDGFS